jgi:hypothetical protein
MRDLVSTISLKRSTQNYSAIHKPPADYPIFALNEVYAGHRGEALTDISS